MEIYIASKTKHAPRWRALREQGVNIISTWIDEAGPGESKCLTDLWTRCIREAATCDLLIVYQEPNEILKGAFIEVGAALAAGLHVYAVGFDRHFSFVNHPFVTQFPSLEAVFAQLDLKGFHYAVHS